MSMIAKDNILAWPDLEWALHQSHKPFVAQWHLISEAGPADADHVARHVIDAAVADIGDLADQLERAKKRIAELEAQLQRQEAAP